jgi:tyrosinase
MSAIAGLGSAMGIGSLETILLEMRSAVAGQTPEAMVEIGDLFFAPDMLEVDSGTTVTWTNNGVLPHTVTADDGSFDSGQLDSGATFSQTFSTAGTFAYHCEFHDEMVATVMVSEAAATPYVRPNVHSSAARLDSYKTAVGNMKMLDADDPRSWSYQANIHGTVLPQSAWLDLFATCQHHTDFFWPWHRMYLYWFEQIIRDQSGDPEFALPYWDYSDPAQQYLPEPFRLPANEEDNPLYVTLRGANQRDETSPPVVDPMFDYCLGLFLPFFGNLNLGLSGASVTLETMVHDSIHGWVGGRFRNQAGQIISGLMSVINTSAQDPVFYLHHANLDRLWASWRALTLNGASHNDPTDASWRDREFEFFDDTGTKLSTPWMVNEVLETTSAKLGYVYEQLADNAWFEANCAHLGPLPAGPPEGGPGTPVPTLELGKNAPEGGIAIGASPVEIPVTLEQPEAGGTPVAISGRPLMLTIEGIEGTDVVAVTIQVYINLPAGQAPDFRTPYYVGNIGLFGLSSPDRENALMTHGATQVFDISRNVAALEEAGEWTGEVTVTFIPVDLNAMSGAPEAVGTPEAAGTPEAVGTPEAAEPQAGPWATVQSISITG